MKNVQRFTKCKQTVKIESNEKDLQQTIHSFDQTQIHECVTKDNWHAILFDFVTSTTSILIAIHTRQFIDYLKFHFVVQ